MSKVCILWLVTILLSEGHCDLYLHIPRGSNNRLNEKSATRKNANRMFDSQNNERGGYNVGDATKSPAGNDESKQYRMKYFQSSVNGDSFLDVEWTNQHGCGGNEDTHPQKKNCQLIMQYMCQDEVSSATGTDNTLRNGVETQKQDYSLPQSLTETVSDKNNRKNNNVKSERGLQESWEWYDNCYIRERNKGLFVADQKLKNNKFQYSSAIYTRQNPNGNRYNYECPEERDYFPYWHPTLWKDAAVLAENETMCSFYQMNSHNVRPYGACVELYAGNKRKHASRWNNATGCEQNGGQWVVFHNYLEKAPTFTSESACTRNSNSKHNYIWAVPYDAEGIDKECLVALEQPECQAAPWSRSNHLGNGLGGKDLSYKWKLPHFPSGDTKRCVFRMRYNISTDDYDPYNTDSRNNTNKRLNIVSPIQDNPLVDIGASSKLKLNLNTDQTGRIFQDRSHVFLLRPRPSNMMSQRIFNLNVRGKRGNIVQVYPAVEYDFHPNSLTLSSNDLVHIQWTGSNTHNNGNPGGDGQAGDEGQGNDGLDRNNLVQISNLNENYPLPMEETSMWSAAEVFWIHHGKTGVSPKDLAVNMASSGYYTCINFADCSDQSGQSVEKKNKLDNKLNIASASYEGAVLKFKAGTYHYMCTRNNNFTNRSQKGTIIVK